MKTKTTHGISFPNAQLLEAAKARAVALGLSLSSYINQLVRKDLGLPNAFVSKQSFPINETEFLAVAEDIKPWGELPRNPADDVLAARAARPTPPPTAPAPKQPASPKGKG